MTGKQTGISFLLISILVICSGCNMPAGGTNESGGPFNGTVEADSFLGNKTISLKWQMDINVDEYMLMRARDEITGAGEYEEVYRGREVYYKDSSVEMDIRYLYRLDKISKGIVYLGQETGLGVGNRAEADFNEPNNTMEQATALSSFKRGTMYHYRFSDGRELTDVDWYKVRIAGSRTEYIQILEDGIAGMTTLLLGMAGKEAIVAEQGKWYELKNEAVIEKEFFLELRPHTESYVGGGMPGGMIRSYTIIRSDHIEDGNGGGNGDSGSGDGGNGNGGNGDGGGGNGGTGNGGNGNGGTGDGGTGNGGSGGAGNGGNGDGGNGGNGGSGNGGTGDGGNGGNGNGGNGDDGNGGNGNGGNGGGDPIIPGEDGYIEERSDFFVANGAGRLMFLLNDRNYQGKNYTFWRYLSGNWNAEQGMTMELIKDSGNFLGGYGYIFAGGQVAGYGECMLVLLIQKDGNYAIGKVINGKYSIIQNWKYSKYLRQGYGVFNTVGVRWDSAARQYAVTINGAEETWFTDVTEPVCNGTRKGIAAVVTWMERFPQTPVMTRYAEK